MGRLNGPYSAVFPVGTKVRIKDAAVLQEFHRTWKFHDPISESQLKLAGQIAVVVWAGYYHGADEMYALADTPGVWHEQLLEPA